MKTNSMRTLSQESFPDRGSDYLSQVACRVKPAEAKYFTYPPSVIFVPFVPQLLIRCSLILWSSVGGQINNDWIKLSVPSIPITVYQDFANFTSITCGNKRNYSVGKDFSFPDCQYSYKENPLLFGIDTQKQ